MIASGSADKSVKFWSMTGETFIKSLSNFSHWVVKVTTMNLWYTSREFNLTLVKNVADRLQIGIISSDFDVCAGLP